MLPNLLGEFTPTFVVKSCGQCAALCSRQKRGKDVYYRRKIHILLLKATSLSFRSMIIQWEAQVSLSSFILVGVWRLDCNNSPVRKSSWKNECSNIPHKRVLPTWTHRAGFYFFFLKLLVVVDYLFFFRSPGKASHILTLVRVIPLQPVAEHARCCLLAWVFG